MSVKIIKAAIAERPTDISAPLVRAAAYCRVSTDSEEQETSYDAQVNHYTEFIRNHEGWILAGIYADSGISGTQTKTRPEFNRMIADCENGKIDITKSISRFARNTLDCLNYVRKLRALNIPILFEKESINSMEASGELLLTILASIAQQESASISQNVKMGIRYGFQAGHGRVNWSVFLGYRCGEKPGTYVIVPEEAVIVRRIYREYLEGSSPGMISSGLTQDAVPTPAGMHQWYPASVTRILTNEKYCGSLLMQKYYTQDFLTHRSVKNTGQRPKYYVEDDHDPIVPKSIFQQVQGELKRRSRLSPSHTRSSCPSVLNGCLICGKCGRSLKPCTAPDSSEITWQCRNRAGLLADTRKGHSRTCQCRPVSDSAAKKAVLSAFNELPDKHEELMCKQAALQTQIDEIDSQIQCLCHLSEDAENLEFSSTETSEEAIKGIPVTTDRHEYEPHAERLSTSAVQMDGLSSERAEKANEETKLRFLLELICSLQNHMRGSECSSRISPITSACFDVDDFYDLTRVHLPSNLLDKNSHMTRFDQDLFNRYVEKIVVNNQEYVVWFKAGIAIPVQV